MEAMPGPRYCAPCRRLLSGTVQFDKKIYFVHHHDANSLEKSLELSCSICSLAYRRIFQHRPIVEGTGGYFFDDDDPDAKVLRLYWDWSEEMAPDIIFVPWKSVWSTLTSCS